MPNWCHNTLTVTGEPNDVAKFVSLVKTEHQPLSFETLVPMPEEYRQGERWYDWSITHWGTKWDASFSGPFVALGGSGADVDETVAALGSTNVPGVTVYKFDTAWSPPEPVVEAASEQFPDLEFELRFGEPGGDYAGRIMCVGGCVIEHEDLKVEDVLAPEEMWF